jgi:hypothetical protein
MVSLSAVVAIFSAEVAIKAGLATMAKSARSADFI